MRKPIHTLGDILDPSSGVTEYVESQGTYNLTLTQNDINQLNKLYNEYCDIQKRPWYENPILARNKK